MIMPLTDFSCFITLASFLNKWLCSGDREIAYFVSVLMANPSRCLSKRNCWLYSESLHSLWLGSVNLIRNEWWILPSAEIQLFLRLPTAAWKINWFTESTLYSWNVCHLARIFYFLCAVKHCILMANISFNSFSYI